MKIPVIPKFDCSVRGNLPFLEVDTSQFTLLELGGSNLFCGILICLMLLMDTGGNVRS